MNRESETCKYLVADMGPSTFESTFEFSKYKYSGDNQEST